MKTSHILGKNARSQIFSYRYNTSRGRTIATSKLLTKSILKKAGIPVPEIYAKFKDYKSVSSFDWNSLPSSFALKPNKGLGGEGIIIVKKRDSQKRGWITTQKKLVTSDDLKLHVMDILEGAYSLDNSPDKAYIEEFVGRHKAFRKYAYRGTPDIRVIVFNKVPVMAMMRLPTKESGGRANLHQGAIAVGIDMATGITTRAFWKGKYILYKPGTKRKLNGIKIPDWTKVLLTAVNCQEATGLGYFGADIVLHPEKGPMVLELNYQPGLQIQIANMAGLRRRLERVEGLDVRDAEHGVKIAKALFAARFSDRVKAEEGIKTVSIFENVKIKGADGKKHLVAAKIDTGAWRSSIDRSLAERLGLLQKDNIILIKRFRSALGKEERPIINLVFWLKGRKIVTAAGVANRQRMRKRLIVGRRDLTGFVLDPTQKWQEKS